MGKMPFHHIFPNPSLTVHHPLPRWEWHLTSPLSRAVLPLPALPCPQGPHSSRATTPTGTPPWAAGPTPTSPHPSCSRATPLPQRPLCHPCRCTRHPQGHWHRYVTPSYHCKTSHFPLSTVYFVFWRFFFSAKKTHKKSWTVYNSKIFSVEVAWNYCFRKTSWSLKWVYPEAVVLWTQKQSQVVKLCCSFLWVSEFAEFQLYCCIFCASALNQIIQPFQR